MKIDNDKRKTLRLLCFLLSALLVMTVSADVYNYMYMQNFGIAAEAAKVKFVTAADSIAAGFTPGTNGTYASFNSMAGWPNATRTYQAACGIENSGSDRTIELKFDLAGDWSGQTDNVDSITVIVRDNAGGTQKGNPITVGTAGSTTTAISIPAGATWVVEWNIKWKATALSTDKVSVKLTLIVTGE